MPMLMLIPFAMLLFCPVLIRSLRLRLIVCLLVFDVRNQPSRFEFCQSRDRFAIVTGCRTQSQ